jgi:FixJ family two-component response regulator
MEFLERGTKPNCILLDINMPGMSGLELQTMLVEDNFDTPIVFITANADIPKSVQAIKAGAIDFLEKPFEDVQLLSAVE